VPLWATAPTDANIRTASTIKSVFTVRPFSPTVLSYKHMPGKKNAQSEDQPHFSHVGRHD
jgi:hypothetical protein